VAQKAATPDLQEKFRRSLEAFAHGDFDGALAFFVPNAEWDMSPMGFVVYEGHEAIRDLFEVWWGAYEHFEQALEDFRDLGNGVTLAAVHQRARLPGSSGFVELRYAVVATWADRLVERVTSYTDIDDARAAAERLAREQG